MSSTDFGYVVNSCPLNKEETSEAATRLKCGEDENGRSPYVCVPVQNLTALVEFCFTKTIVAFYEIGHCLRAVGDGHLDQFSCKNFTEGCPAEHFRSTDLYKYPACHHINTEKGCFVADPFCYATKNVTTGIISTPILGILNISTDHTNYSESNNTAVYAELGSIGAVIGVITALLVFLGIIMIWCIFKRGALRQYIHLH
ncbi:uncharacterized protein LOC134262100 [Saccostrea cucullata]|uniref:uncharacterized protein LOC134262100 n=1 Tax=Saccostrea cuccullata TaxID=36930 RepID=UPI002ED35F47